MSQVIALDFDGVICDSLKECTLVTWAAYHTLDVSYFGEGGWARLPSQFVRQFRRLRSFARTIGHFLVPVVYQNRSIRTQQEFDTAFFEIDPPTVDRFVSDLTLYRTRVRLENYDQWLRYQSIFPGMSAALASQRHPTYIVSAKDHESVQNVLIGKGIQFASDHVIAGQNGKLDALWWIARAEDVTPDQVWFLDDSIANVQEAQSAGFTSLWAKWGYGHRERASSALHAEAVRGLGRAEFLRYWGSEEVRSTPNPLNRERREHLSRLTGTSLHPMSTGSI